MPEHKSHKGEAALYGGATGTLYGSVLGGGTAAALRRNPLAGAGIGALAGTAAGAGVGAHAYKGETVDFGGHRYESHRMPTPVTVSRRGKPLPVPGLATGTDVYRGKEHVGYVDTQRSALKPKNSHVVNAYVAPKHRGQSIGTRAVKENLKVSGGKPSYSLNRTHGGDALVQRVGGKSIPVKDARTQKITQNMEDAWKWRRSDLVDKSYVPGQGFVSAAKLGKEGLRGKVKPGMYKPGRNRANERTLALLKAGRKDIDDWAKGSFTDTKTVQRGGVTEIHSDRPDQFAAAAAGRIGGKSGKKVMLINTGTQGMGPSRKQLYTHEMAHLNPKRTEWRISQIQRSARKSGREEGRADMDAGIYNRRYSKDMRRAVKGSQRAGTNLMNRGVSGYAAAAAHEPTRRAQDMALRAASGKDAMSAQRALFSRASIGGYRQVQGKIARSRGDLRVGVKKPRKEIGKAYSKNQRRDSKGRWTSRLAHAYVTPKPIVRQTKDMVYDIQPLSPKTIKRNLKESLIASPLVGAGIGGAMGASIGTTNNKISQSTNDFRDAVDEMLGRANPKPKAPDAPMQGLGGRTILDEKGKVIPNQAPAADPLRPREKVHGKWAARGRGAAIGAPIGAGLGLLMAPALVERHRVGEYPRDDDKAARNELPRSTAWKAPNLANDYKVVVRSRTRQERGQHKTAEGRAHAAKVALRREGSLTSAGVAYALPTDWKRTAHLEPVEKAILRPMKPPAMGIKAPKMVTPTKAPTLPSMKVKKPAGIKLPQLPKPPRPGY